MSAEMIRLSVPPFGPLAFRPASPAGSTGFAAAPDLTATGAVPQPVKAPGPARAPGLAGSRHDQSRRRTARPEQHHHRLHRNHHRARHRRRLLGHAGRGAGRGQAGVGRARCRTLGGRVRSGDQRPESGGFDFSERRPERDAGCGPSPPWWGRKRFQRLGFSQVLEIAREGVLLRHRLLPRTPSPTKSATWPCRSKTAILCPLPQGERAARLPVPPDRAAAFGGARVRERRLLLRR
jgi:hypothetical protein